MYTYLTETELANWYASMASMIEVVELEIECISI